MVKEVLTTSQIVDQIEVAQEAVLLEVPEAGIQRCSYEKVFWKYAVYLQENTHAKVWFQ